MLRQACCSCWCKRENGPDLQQEMVTATRHSLRNSTRQAQHSAARGTAHDAARGTAQDTAQGKPSSHSAAQQSTAQHSTAHTCRRRMTMATRLPVAKPICKSLIRKPCASVALPCSAHAHQRSRLLCLSYVAALLALNIRVSSFIQQPQQS